MEIKNNKNTIDENKIDKNNKNKNAENIINEK